MRGRHGHSLPELLVAVVLSAIVFGALAGAVIGGERLARSHGRRVQVAEALRVAEAALGGDLRVVAPTADLRAVGEDSILLRVFRGAGIVCATGAGHVAVRYRGMRTAEPEKDSVLVVDDLGRATPVALTATATAAGDCTGYGDEALYRWTLDGTAPPGTLLLVFETGGYHLSGSALRYRRGESGRQPLTAELLDVRLSGFRMPVAGGAPVLLESATAIEGELAVRPDPSVRRHRAGVPSVRLRHALLNGRSVRDPGVGGEP